MADESALLTPAAFAQTIKAKYPDYASVPDDVLAAKMLEKYPEYRDRVQPATYSTTNQKDANGNAVVARNFPFGANVTGAQLDQAAPALDAAERERTQAGRDFLNGVGKSIAGTIAGGGKLIRSVPVVGPLLGAADVKLPAPINLQPTNQSEGIGKTAGDIGQFFVPGSALGKAKKALATGSGILDALVSAGLEGASAAGVQSAQKGTTEGAGKTAAITAGVPLGVQGTLSGVGWLGKRVESALVKATTADVNNAFKVGNIFKYKLGGSLGQTYDKSQAKLSDLTDQLRQALSTAKPGASPQIDVLGALAETASDLAKRATTTFGSNANIEAAIDKLLNDPMFQSIARSGKTDIAAANEVKQAIGDLGAWLHDPSGRVMRDPDSKGMEIVANALYTKLKTAIEQQAVGPVAAINRAISEILPIRQAVIRRIPIEQRQNVLNLGDLLSYSTGTWGLSLANRLLKGGTAARLMVGASEASPTVAPYAARGVGGASSQVPEQ